MEFVLSLKDLVYLGSILTGFLTSFLLIFFATRKKKTNILIGLSFFSLTYSIVFAFLINSGYYVLVPVLYRTGNITALLFSPLAYLYIEKIITQKKFRIPDLLHFLPALIYLIDFAPIIFFTSTPEKLNLILEEIDNPQVFVYFNQSRFFPPNFYTLGRTFLIMVYWVISMRLLVRQTKSDSEQSRPFGKPWVNWMKTYQFSGLLLFVPFLILFRFSDSELYYDLIHFSGALVILINSVTILFFPKILYGLDENKYQESLKVETGKTESPEPIAEDKSQEIQIAINQVLEVDKKFLENGYSINEMAKDTGIPSYLLTQFINRNLNTTFPELINRKRIEECCRRISSQEFRHLTLEALGEECGFNNRNTFISSFKKFKGCTPSQYLKSLQE